MVQCIFVYLFQSNLQVGGPFPFQSNIWVGGKKFWGEVLGTLPRAVTKTRNGMERNRAERSVIFQLLTKKFRFRVKDT